MSFCQTKGSGISTLWPQMLALLVFGVAILAGSVLRTEEDIQASLARYPVTWPRTVSRLVVPRI